MMKIEQPQPEVADDLEPSTDPSVSEQVALVTENLRALVKAEVHYYRSRLDYTREVLAISLRYGAVAAGAFFGATIAVVLGSILTLSPLIGPLAATLLVTGIFAVVGVICGILARKWARKISFPEIQESDDDGA